MSQLTVWAPALSPPADWLARHRDRLPRLPALARCLARAQRTAHSPAASDETILFSLFELPVAVAADLPVAAAMHWADFEDGHDGCWLRADPVTLRPDLGKLLLFDASHFTLARDEADLLLTELNRHLQCEGLQLAAGADGTRWYLWLPSPAAIRTTAPRWINGQHIDPYLPAGPDAARWRRLGNELQMVLHQSPVNAARGQRGEVPVNSVWFWGGGGSLPAARPQVWDLAITDYALAAGLARSQGSPVLPAGEEILRPFSGGGRILIAITRGVEALQSGDYERWEAAVQALERQCFAPLLAALRQGAVQRLTLDLGGSRYTLVRGDLWRFWRRRPRGAYPG